MYITNLLRNNIPKILTGLILIFTTSICTASKDQLIVDQYWSPFAGTALNLSIFHTYTFLDDQYLPSSEGKVTVFWALGRIGKLFIDDVISEYLMVFQHEVFGHGYRFREFDFKSIGYYVGYKHGYTDPAHTSYNTNLSSTLAEPKKAAISAAGMEANAVFSQQIRENWIFENKIDRREAWLYLITSLDQSEYIMITDDDETSLGNDVYAYVNEVNAWYQNAHLSPHKLHRYALWDLLDPSLYFGLYTVGDYLLKGTPHLPMPMVHVKGYDYIFSSRLLLSPFGPEFQIQNYVVTPKHKLLQINVRYGNNSQIQSYGLDFFMRPIWRYKEWKFSNKLYLWSQPKFLKQSLAAGVKTGLGIADFVAAEYKFYKCFAAYGEFGYKTAGYIQGVPLSNSWVWRIGFSLYH